MNYIVLITEILLTFFLIFLAYKMGKKDGLYFGIGLFSSILCVMLFKMINMFDFDVNMGIPFIVGILLLNNIIIHRYGFDETTRILRTFGIAYILTYMVIMITTLTIGSKYNLASNDSYNLLFGYDLSNNVYDNIRKNKNNIIFNNVGSILVVLFIESIIFVSIAHIGNYTVVELFGMIVIRYLIEVVIGLLGLIPVYLIVKRKDK